MRACAPGKGCGVNPVTVPPQNGTQQTQFDTNSNRIPGANCRHCEDRNDVDPMHKSTSPKRKFFKPYAVASSVLATVGIAAGLIAGVTPAAAADLAHNPDTQIAIFMIPLTLLVLVMMFEVTRAVLRGNVPAELPAARNRRPLSLVAPSN